MDNTSNNPTDDTARGRQQEKNGSSGRGIWCSCHKTTTHRDAGYGAQQKQDSANDNIAIVQPSRVGMCKAPDLPDQDNEPGRPHVNFSATQVTQIEKNTWSLGPMPTICSMPPPWPLVERSRPIISLDEEDKPDVTPIHGIANEDGVHTYGKALMASESPRVEQNLHDGHNPVTALVKSEASGNYFDNQSIPQPLQISRCKDFSRRHLTLLEPPSMTTVI